MTFSASITFRSCLDIFLVLCLHHFILIHKEPRFTRKLLSICFSYVLTYIFGLLQFIVVRKCSMPVLSCILFPQYFCRCGQLNCLDICNYLLVLMGYFQHEFGSANLLCFLIYHNFRFNFRSFVFKASLPSLFMPSSNLFRYRLLRRYHLQSLSINKSTFFEITSVARQLKPPFRQLRPLVLFKRGLQIMFLRQRRTPPVF